VQLQLRRKLETCNFVVPLQPTGLQAPVLANNAIQLLRNTPPQNNVEILAYVVYYNSTPGRHERIDYRPDAARTKVVSQRLVGLAPGTTCTVRVSAKGRESRPSALTALLKSTTRVSSQLHSISTSTHRLCALTETTHLYNYTRIHSQGHGPVQVTIGTAV
jgi:hypothetical protein